MRSASHFLALITITFIATSCGVGGNSISELKLIPVKTGDGNYQYIDTEGNIIIAPEFSRATVFREGLALVRSSGNDPKYGFISEDGTYTIDAQYTDATVFSEGLAWVVSSNSAPSAIDKTGEVKLTLQDAGEVRLFKEGLAAFRVVNEKGDWVWGFVDQTGEVAVEPQFKAVSDFSDGLCRVLGEDNKWGFINKEGYIVIDYQFVNVTDFTNGKSVATVVETETDSLSQYFRTGVIDEDGKFVLDFQSVEMEQFKNKNVYIDGNLFLVDFESNVRYPYRDSNWNGMTEGRYGWFNEDGELVINPQFERAFPFNGNSLTPVQVGGKFGYIDREGKLAINPQFDVALPFNGKIAAVGFNDNLGFIEKDGTYRINPQPIGPPDDFYFHILYGASDYSSITTQYFNVDVIKAIDFGSAEGFTFNSTYREVLNKYGLEEKEFLDSGNNRFHRVFHRAMTYGAELTFAVEGRLFDRTTVQKTSRWGAYTDIEYIPNFDNKPTVYHYRIRVEPYEWTSAALNAIVEKLSDHYELDEGRSNLGRGFYVFYDGSKEISVERFYGQIEIEIKSNT